MSGNKKLEVKKVKSVADATQYGEDKEVKRSHLVQRSRKSKKKRSSTLSPGAIQFLFGSSSPERKKKRLILASMSPLVKTRDMIAQRREVFAWL